jgi:Domain of unknown function (DUF4214)
MAITVAMRTQVSQLYVSLFGRAPDGEGLGFWVAALDGGMTIAQIAESMYNTAPARNYYPAFATNQEIVSTFYQNVLGRPADAEGLAFWTAELQAAPSKGAFFTKLLNNVVNYTGTDAAGLKSQALFLNKVAVAQFYGETNGNVAGATVALNGVTELAASVDAAKAAIVGGSDQTFMLTAGFDSFVGNNKGGAADDQYLGAVNSAYSSTGTQTTFNPGDAIDGGTGANTLRLFMDQGAIADGTNVSNIQTLDLRLNAGGTDNYSQLVMTDWDASLQQINIRSNKSEIDILEQQVIADVSISDQSSIINGTAYYGFNYAAGVVDGAADALNMTLDNVNGEDGAYVGIDDGIEQLDLTIADRAGTLAAPNRYASDVVLVAGGATDVSVDGGRAGQTFELNANIANGANFDSTEFAGDMLLASGNIETAAFGAGDDVASFWGGSAASVDAAYNMGEGDNTLILNVAFAGQALAGAGADTIAIISTLDGAIISAGNGNNDVDVVGVHAGAITTGTGVDDISVGSTATTGSIAAGDGDNSVSIAGAHSGAVTTGSGNDEVSAASTTAGAVVSLDLRGLTLVADSKITLSVSFVVAQGVQSVEHEFTLVGANAAAIRANLVTAIAASDIGDLFGVVAETTPTGVIALTSALRLPELEVSSSSGLMSIVSQSSSSINVGSGDNSVAVSGENSGVIQAGSGDDSVVVGSTTLGSSINAGHGDNFVVVGEITEADDVVTIVGAVHDGDIIVGEGNDEIVVGDTGAYSTIAAGEGNNTVGVDGVHAGAITAGNGTNLVSVGNEMAVGSTITLGNGDQNEITVGDVDVEPTTPMNTGDMMGTIVVGNGDENHIHIAGDVIGGEITVGDGASNVLEVAGDIDDESTITMGDGGNTVSASNIVYSDVTLGDGSDALNVEGYILTSNVQMGGGADTLTLGTTDGYDYGVGWAEDTDAKKTLIDMGAGNDTIDLVTAGGSLNDDYGFIYSGGFIKGGEGADKLTLSAASDADLIQRDLNQLVEVDLHKVAPAVYTVGEQVSVVFTRGDDSFTVTYTVKAADFIQGADNVAAKVAQGLTVALNEATDTFGAHFATATTSAGVITIESDAPHRDFDITSTTGSVEVLQLSDAGITSVETLQLTALDTEGSDIEIEANFDLIEGTHTVLLDSQLKLVAEVQDEDLNGSYTEYSEGGETTFSLNNLKGGEAITVSGDETSATGNQQVERITVNDGEGNHVIGDKILVTIGETLVTYTVTAADLVSDTPEEDAINIAANLAAALADAAYAAGYDVALDDAQITLVAQTPGVEAPSVYVAHVRDSVYEETLEEDTSSWDVAYALWDELRADDVVTVTIGDDAFTFTVSAEDCERCDADNIINAIVAHFGDDLASFDWGYVNFAEDATITMSRNEQNWIGQTNVSTELYGSETDDSTTDVYVNAQLADTATDTTMNLTVAGEGSFDMVIDGGEASRFTALDLKLGDSHDHTIDTGGLGFAVVPAFYKLMMGGSEQVGFDIAFYDVLFTTGAIARINIGNDNLYISEDGGETFEEYMGTFEEWAEYEAGFASPEEWYLAMQTVTAYSDEPGAEGVQTYTFDTTSEPVGNFSDAIVVDDVVGVNTAGSNITLDNVLASTVDTTGSAANYNIDQYNNVRSSDYEFGLSTAEYIDETLTVTTGTGDDHLTTLAQSAMNAGSSIDLGTGRNSLSLGWGAGVELEDQVGSIEEYNQPKYAVSATYDASSDTVRSVAELIAGGGSKVLPTIAVGTRVDGQINESDELDAFAVTLEAGKTYQLSFFTSSSLGYTVEDTDFFAYGPDRERISQGLFANGEDSFDGTEADPDMDALNTSDFIDDVYEGEARVFTAPTSGTYYFEIGGHAPYYTGTYTFEVSEVDLSNNLISLDFSEMNYSGGLAEFELLNNIYFSTDKTLVMPGAVDNVEVLKVSDFYSSNNNDLTIVGAANDFSIESLYDFDLGTGNLTIQNAAGVETTGSLTVTTADDEDGDVSFNIGNTDLSAVNIVADEDIDLHISNKDGGQFDIGAIDLFSEDNEAQLLLENNTDTIIHVASLNVESDEDSDLEINDNVGSELSVGDVTLNAYDWSDADVFIEDNSDTTITLGNVSLTVEDADTWDATDISFEFSDNDNVELTVSSLEITSDFDVQLEVDNSTDSNVTIHGDILLAANGEDGYYDTADVDLDITDNTRSNVSLAVDGTITIESCEDDVSVYIADNLNDHQPTGNGPDANGQYASFTIELGDLVLDAGIDAYLTISGNTDDTFFGDLTVSTGDISVLAYDSADFEVGSAYDNWDEVNDSVTVEMGNIDIFARNDLAFDLSNNYGRIYDLGNVYTEENRYQQDNAVITAEDVTLTSDYSNVDANIDHNQLAVIELGNVNALTRDQYANIWFCVDDNLSTNFQSGDIALSSQGYQSSVYFSFYENSDRNDYNGESVIVNRYTVDGDLTLDATYSANAEIYGNYGGYGDNYQNLEITVTGDTELNAEDDYAELNIESNDYTWIELQGGVTVSSSSDFAALTLSYNDDTEISIEGQTTITGEDGDYWYEYDYDYVYAGAVLVISDNDDSNITMVDSSAEINLLAASENDYDVKVESTWDDANVYIEGNDSSDITIGDLVVIADEDALINIDDNDDSDVTIGDVYMDASDDTLFNIEDNSDCSDVSIGDVEIYAYDDAEFYIYDNDGWWDWWSDIEVAVNWVDDELVRGTIVIEGASVGYYDDYSGVDVNGNDSAYVELGNFDVTATDGDADLNFNTGWRNDLSVGTIDVEADEDVYFTAEQDDYDSTLELGDITITSGAQLDGEDWDDISSDIFFDAYQMETSETGDDAAQSITLDAQSKGDGEGNVFADIDYAYDLESLTVSGTNAELYLHGDTGNGDFTLDLTSMTGTFYDGARYYNPLGSDNSSNYEWEYSDWISQDDGTFVSTAYADFEGDVTVKIGSGDVIYNAQHSDFGGYGEDFEYDGYNTWSDWDGNDGWYSLGDGLDLDPVREEQRVDIWIGDGMDGWYEGDIVVDQMVINVGAKTFIVTWDGWGEDEDDFSVEWWGHDSDMTLDEMAWEIGASDASIYVDEYWGTNAESYDYVVGSLYFYGPTNGTDFADADLITSASAEGVQYFWDADDGGNWEAHNYSESKIFTQYDGNAADDGLGNVASETFEFDGTGIGEVVIGGFRPNGFYAANEVDRLDFSAFDDINSAADLIITIDDNDGYFDDVIIDFVNDDYGVVRLVGVGEYFTDLNVNGIANSIIFA